MQAPKAELFSLAALVESIADAHRRAVAQVLERFGVSGSTAGLLWVLGTAEEPMTMRRLAERLSCDPSTVTLLAEHLEKEGLAERAEDQDDRRRRILRLTPRGTEAWAHVEEEILATSPLRALDGEEILRVSDVLGDLKSEK
jgi:DNA-binding MarR family transcriptional regulator